MVLTGNGEAGGRRLRAAAVLLALLLPGLAACAGGGTIEDAVPSAALGAPAGGPRNTGEYPNLNIPQKGETSQFSKEDVRALTGELNAEKARAASERTAVSTDSGSIRQIGRTHAGEALKDIEAE